MEDTLPGPLFSPGEAEDPYRNLRDMVTPAAGEGKEFAERLWRQYYPFADAKFLTDLEGLVDQKNADQLGIDFLVVHNPRALRRVPHGLLPATREYWATPVNGGHELSCHDTTGADSRTAGRGFSISWKKFLTVDDTRVPTVNAQKMPTPSVHPLMR
jgi:hypothetical protein